METLTILMRHRGRMRTQSSGYMFSKGFALNIRILMGLLARANCVEACHEEVHAAAGQGVPPTHPQNFLSHREVPGAKPELLENVLMLDIMQPGGPILWGTWFRLWQVCKQWVCFQTTMCSGAAPCIILGAYCHSSPYRVSFDITNGSPKMIVINRAE